MYKGFTQVELRKPQRATFDLSHEKRLSTRMGRLTPIFISETMPNDSFYGSSEVLVRVAPLLAPVFHRVNLYVHYFFIPNRLLWDDWEEFITGGRLGDAITNPPLPPRLEMSYMAAQGRFELGSLADYLGIPPIPTADSALWQFRTVDAMPFAAYYRCWYDYYRDRNYTPDNELLPLASGENNGVAVGDIITQIRQRAWQHDYFTSALPFTQRGTEVLMPLSGSGSVVSSIPDGTPLTPGSLRISGASTLEDSVGVLTKLELDESNVSINDLRRAIRLQEWMERNALAGSRYNESIMAHFGRKTSDSRLQRAEYLGGGKAVIQISEINSTAYSLDADAEVVPVGTPSGRGSVYANTNKFSYNCEEHGFIIGILSVMPTSSYMQGIPRMFQQRETFLDYPWPSFAHLGEQEVFDNEIYMDPTSLPIDRTQQPLFGYQSRYADWKHIPSSSHGDFRMSLDYWHVTRKFSSQPVLGEAFVTFEDELQDRIFAVSGVDTLWMYIYNKINVKRSLPYFGTPML